jgi:hypothetical protein
MIETAETLDGQPGHAVGGRAVTSGDEPDATGVVLESAVVER